MKIVWDEPKREANLIKHQMDFASLTEGFFESSVVVPVKEGRYAAVGHHFGDAILVVFAVLGTEAISVISMRPASRSERRLIDG